MENLSIYNQCREVPQTACKTIQEGKLKGKTDINPMWRIQKLTEVFGPCGFGWYITDVEHWLEKSEVTYRDNTTNTEITAYVQVALVVKLDGKWSEKIIGIGGSKLVGKGQGDQANDECFKMAYTDAISVACKMLGMGADLVEVTDRYSIQQGQDDKWEYYGKVIDDSARIVTVILRYYPEHVESVEALKEWVRAFDVK